MLTQSGIENFLRNNAGFNVEYSKRVLKMSLRS